MPVFFATTPGSTIALPDNVSQAVFRPLLTVKNNPFTFAASKSIVTRISFSSQTNQQFLHSLGGDVYIYVFGDRVGEFSISGLAMGLDCDKSGDPQHGIEKVYKYYSDNKLSKRPAPLQIVVGQRTSFQAFMADFSADVYDHKLNLFQYRIGMFLLPEKTK